MPGKKISDHQVLQYKKQRQTRTQSAAAAIVGISERSAQRIEAGQGLPSQQAQRLWRTRVDPFEAMWDCRLVPLLEANPHLTATTLFEELERRRPGEYAAGQVRTIQRRARNWRAQHGPGRAVFFAQEHPPGRQGLSDFTVADDVGVTIGGAAFPHRLYHTRRKRRRFSRSCCSWKHGATRDASTARTSRSTSRTRRGGRSRGCAKRRRRFARAASPAPGRFALEAAIQAQHVARRHGIATNWAAIAALYDVLAQSGAVGALVSRAAAHARAHGNAVGLAALAQLDLARVATYQPYWAVRAHLTGDANDYDRAIGLAQDEPTRSFLAARRNAAR